MPTKRMEIITTVSQSWQKNYQFYVTGFHLHTNNYELVEVFSQLNYKQEKAMP